MSEPLYQFQKNAVDRIAKGDQVYLGFDMGLGKSRTALEAAKKRGVGSLLIIAPASGRYVWARECAKWWPGKPFRIVRGPADLFFDGILLVTYGLLSQKDSPCAAAVAKRKWAFEMTILDEAAAVKSLEANRTKAILGPMLPKLGYVLPMSGTPAPNHAGELYPILRALYPKALANGSGGALAQWQFEDQFCNVRLKKFGQGNPIRVIEGSRNLPALRERISPFMLRVRKETVLKDLPPVRYDVVPIGVDYTAAQQIPGIPASITDDDDILAYLSGKTGDEHVMKVRRLLGILKITPAVEYILDFMDGLPTDRKVIVFAHHRDVVSHLAAGLKKYHPAIVMGSTTPDIRSKEIDTFLSDRFCRIFIGNIQAAGTGITLIGDRCKCSDVIFVEASYSVGDNVQAAARVHRIGQHEAVVARFLTAHGTMDDRIQDILARKARDFKQLFD